MAPPQNKLAKARHIYREHGARALRLHATGYVRARLGRASGPAVGQPAASVAARKSSRLPPSLAGAASVEEVLAADWTTPRTFERPHRSGGPLTLNWVIPGANAGSGGHQNIFRFIAGMEQRGHECRIYVHDPHEQRAIEQHAETVRAHFEPMDADIELLAGPMKAADAVIATSWPTAYPVFLDPSEAPRFYFVQDFEPLFYSLGTEYVLAENTYRFGFRGITAGGWLSHKLHREYGMQCIHYDFGAESDLYSLRNRAERNAILFYARPPTPRRAFELGLLTLSLFAKDNPDVDIHMAGWPLKGYQTDFSYVDHGVLPLGSLNELYNELSAALVLSLTNCSLLPLELLAAGCVPVMNDAPNNRMVVDNPHIRYCQPSPHALSGALAEACRTSNCPGVRESVAASVATARWDDACDRVERALVEVLRA